MCAEQLALQHAEYAFHNAVLVVEVLGCPWSMAVDRSRGLRTSVARGDVEERAQRVVYALLVPTSRGHNVVELCAGGSVLAG